MSKIRKRWTLEQLEDHIKVNVTDYGAIIVVSALFKKLYGRYPKVGLSGYQAEAINSVVDVLKEPNV